jgi:hypothetical protein
MATTALPFGSYSLNGRLYARGLGQMLRAIELYDTADRALSNDPAAYERLRTDAVVAFAIRLRKLLSSGTDWFLEPASTHENDRRVLQICEHLLKHIESFGVARFNLAEAIIAGSRWAEIDGEEITTEIAGVPTMTWWVPRNLRDVDKRRMRQHGVPGQITTRKVQFRDGGGQLTEQDVPFQTKEWRWQIWRPLNQIWEDIDRDEFIRHVNDDREDTLGYGGGLASEIYTYWYAKEVVLQLGLQFIERWAQGIVIAHVDSLRDGLASNPTSAQKMSEWLKALRTMRTEHSLVADAKDRLDVIDAPSGGWAAAMQALDYLDGSIRVCILGASLPTTKDAKGGSYAMAEIQQGVSDLLGRFDRSGQEQSLRRDLLGWCWRKNYQNFRQLGLSQCNLPYFRIREDRREDHEIRANVLLKCRQAGMEIRRDEAYAQTGFSPPARGDEILPSLKQSESDRQEGIPKGKPGAASGAGVPMNTPDQIQGANPGRPFEKKGNHGLDREQGADAKAKGFSSDLDAVTARFEAKLVELAGRQPNITVNVPERTVNVEAQLPPQIYVEAPKQAAPVVNVAAAVVPTPNVTLNMPEQAAPVVNVAAASQPSVVVNVPRAAAPIVHVAPPSVNVAAPTVNVAAPNVTVESPTVHVAAPKVKVDVAAPNVTVTPPANGGKKLSITRDQFGRIGGLEIQPPDPPK